MLVVERQALVIDFNAPPMIPPTFEYREEDQFAGRMTGEWKLNPNGLYLHLSRNQKRDDPIVGRQLIRGLKNKPVAGAQLLDFYLNNRHLIPLEWRGHDIYFWGTIYRDDTDHKFVRHLFWDKKKGYWWWNYHWLGFKWKMSAPALCINKDAAHVDIENLLPESEIELLDDEDECD